MKVPALSIAVLSLCTFVPAQQDPPKPAASKPANDTKAQDPEVVREPTPQERIATLKGKIAKLRGELTALEDADKSGGVPARVKARVGSRQLKSQSFSDPNPPKAEPAQPAPVPVAKKAARLLGDAEKKGLAADVIFTVDGQSVTESEFKDAVAYLKSYPRAEDDDALKTQAVMELVRVKAAMAAFPETGQKARTKILAIQERLKSGGLDFGELATDTSDCPSKTRGGDLGYFGRVGMDFWFTRCAFSLEVGEVSDVIPTSFGYHLIKVTGKEKGDTGEHDRVRASHILTLYGDQTQLAQVSRQVNSGQTDLAFVSDDYRKYAPPAYK